MKKHFKSFDDTSIFGDGLKYILVLTILAWMTYSLPSVQAAMSGISMTFESDMLAAATTSNPTQARELLRKAIGTKPAVPVSALVKRVEDRKHELTPQQVVTLLVGLGIIPKDRLDEARIAIEKAQQGTTTPAIAPCRPIGSATSTKGVPLFATSTHDGDAMRSCAPMPMQGKEIMNSKMPPRMASTSPRMGDRPVKPQPPTQELPLETL